MLVHLLFRYSCLLLFSGSLVSGLDVPFEPYPVSRQSNPRVANYRERSVSVSSSEEDREDELVARINDDLSDEDFEPSAYRRLENLKNTSTFRKPDVAPEDELSTNRKNKSVATRILDYSPRDEKTKIQENQVLKKLPNDQEKFKESSKNEKLHEGTRSIEYIDDQVDNVKDDFSEVFVDSEEDVDEDEKPKLRVFEENEGLKVIPALENEEDDDENATLDQITGNETIAYRSMDFFEKPTNDNERTTINETSAPSTIAPHGNINNTKTRMNSSNRDKKHKNSDTKRKGNFSNENSKKKSTKNTETSREKIFAQNTRKSQVLGEPMIYREKSKSKNIEKNIKKYEGIDRRPSLKPLLTKIKMKPEMEFLHYDTIVRSRYAKTTVTGRVKNYGESRYINVNIVLPHNALITQFQTNVNDETTVAVVRDTNSTMSLPKASVNGENVGTMLVETRDCDAVALAVEVQRDATLNYTITYEYLLKRNLGVYSVPITIHNNMWIKDLSVRWKIQEERNLTNLITPLIHKTTALSLDDTDDLLVCIINEEPGIAEVTWEPTINEQKNISRRLGKLSKRGVVGILELRYDVSHDQDPCGQVVRKGGYFAQFFAAPNQPPLAKHVVFILDVSDSMSGDPIKQLKTAMNYILDTLQPMDTFTLINFSDEVNIMNIYDRTRDTVYRGVGVGPDGRGKNSGKTEWPGSLESYEATPNNIKAAKEAVKMMKLRAYTNIYDALIMGFKSVKDKTALPPTQTGQPHPEPFIIFLTDGHASDGPSYDHDVILKMVEDQNHNTKATMFALGFGGEADMGLLRRFALATNGIEKHIYKDIDAADQLVTFFQSIKAPVLKDVYFKYSSKQVITATLTEQSFPMIHHGKEVIIAGKLDPSYPEMSSLYVDVTAIGRYAMIRCERTKEISQNSTGDSVVIKYSNTTAMGHDVIGTISNQAISAGTVERIWGLRTLRQLLDEVELDHFETHQDTRCDDTLKPLDRMLEICIRLNYAMPTVTNLVYNNTLIERISISPESGDQPDEVAQFDPLAEYPWILKLRDKHGFAKLPITNQKKGRMYTYLSLGVSEDPPPPRSCADSIDGSPGECRYLPECPDPRVLGTPEKFRRHFCRLGSYAGVCCSKSAMGTSRSKRYVR